MRFDAREFDKRRMAIGIMLGLSDEAIGFWCDIPLLTVKQSVKSLLKEANMSREEFAVNWNSALKYPKCEYVDRASLLVLYQDVGNLCPQAV